MEKRLEPSLNVALLSLSEMYAADRAAMDSGVAGERLMENAGRAVADGVVGRWSLRPVTVLCGPGNNGGDGFVAARHLAARGWPVSLALLGDKGNLKGDAAHHAGRWTGEIHRLSPQVLDGAGVVIDALFGAGLDRPLAGAAAEVVESLGSRGLPVAAVDIPSGVNGNSGSVLGEAVVDAETTITFFRKKPGHLLFPGRFLCGELQVADIGIPESVLPQIAPMTFENDPCLWFEHYPRRRYDSHKYDFGHALVVGGGELTGAGRLAARAALRVGAGLVSLACPKAAVPIYAADFPSLMVRSAEGPEDLEALLRDTRRNAVLIGPGIGLGEDTRVAVQQVLEAHRATILDADALSAFSDDPERLIAGLGDHCVLTPHEGEFARVFPRLEGDKLSRARCAAAESGAVILLKGADTVIAAPDGRAAINSNAPPELATAGSGDVLAGLVLGLMAQKLPAFEAACAAVWFQGETASLIGPGLIAEDLPDRLPEILQGLLSAN